MENLKFDGREGAPIDLALAAEWTANYRATIQLGDIKGHYFGKDILNDILAQEGCMGIRMYYALDKVGVKQLILVGVDAYENDQVGGIVADYSMPCPDHCGNVNVLNA